MQGWMWIVLAVAVASVGFVFWTYNRLVGLSQRADGAWSDIDVQLKRRWDLVPALVETVKGYARHERETLEQTIAARGRAQEAASEPAGGRGQAETGLTAAVGRLFAIAEAYPELKADGNFLGLQRDLVAVEDHLQAARRYYNAVVRDLNTAVQSFPAVLLAGPMGFGPREFFQLDDAKERQNPEVKLGP